VTLETFLLLSVEGRTHIQKEAYFGVAAPNYVRIDWYFVKDHPQCPETT